MNQLNLFNAKEMYAQTHTNKGIPVEWVGKTNSSQYRRKCHRRMWHGSRLVCIGTTAMGIRHEENGSTVAPHVGVHIWCTNRDSRFHNTNQVH